MPVQVNPYIPSFLRAAMTGSRPLVLTGQSLADTNVLSSASFQYDPAYNALKSTQQLNVDWSQFQNHTFFMSAEAKVNLAFDQIINGYPFDGTRLETEVFFDNLTGFDKWVFDNFPTFHGELLFSSSGITTSSNVPAIGPTQTTNQPLGSWIAVQNKVGSLFPELITNQNNPSGQAVLNPTGSQSLTIEMQIYLPPVANDVQVICQMLDPTNVGTPVGGLSGSVQGFSLYLTQSLSTGSVDAHFVVVSGSSYMTVPLTLNKGQFNHVAFELNRDTGMPFLESFLLSIPVAESVTQVEIDDMAIDDANFLIGVGTPVQYGNTVIVPKQTLGATIDEFRVFHSARTSQQQAAYASKALYATSDLALYFRFNEPTGSLNAANQFVLLDGTSNPNSPINAIVLDSSGNSLHALIANFTASLRQDATLDPLNPISNERPDQCPVLFPAYPPILALNQQLLMSASVFDSENPNLITKLIPQHYLLEGAHQDGFGDDTPEGDEGQPFGGTGIPGTGKMGNVQILVSLLYIYARFFDEIKLFLDSFSSLRTVDYDTGNQVAPDTVPDNFLNTLIKNYGFHMPPLFQDADIDQYVRGENVAIDDFSTNVNTLRYVQHTLTRRILKNLPSVLRSKGTQYSIQAFLRSVGIDPNNIMRMREVGGPTTQALQFVRDTKVEPGAMVWFSGSTNLPNNIYVASPYLSASRVEPGWPPPQGQFVVDPNTGRNIGTTIPSDNVLTSGSWTWEGIVKFTPSDIGSMQSATQSLMRMCVVGGEDNFGDDIFGSESPFGFEVSLDENMGLVANLIAVSSSLPGPGNGPKLVFYVRPNALPGGANSPVLSPILRLEIDTALPNVFTGPKTIGIFDNDRWNVSFGCQRGDDGLNSQVSSSYFLRLATQNNGEITYLFQTSSFFQEDPFGGDNIFRGFMTTSSFPGPFLAVGTGQLIPSGTGTGSLFLNNILAAPDEARVTDFTGRLSNVRFWSKALTLDEWSEHVRNYNSVGVEDPLTNWNYVNNATGSWGRLRMNTFTKQDTRNADFTGSIRFIDFSENLLHMTGSGFQPNQEVVVGEIFDLSFFSPYFDEATTNNKVRARSFQNFALVEATPWAQLAPVYEVPPSEKPSDDTRFIMEFSLIEALNRDIIAIFSTLDALDNAMGNPDLLFSPDYPQIENLRDIYFNRIKGKLNFDSFLVFFRWFDTAIGQFISQLIPRKTNFKGVNFTIESHMFERHKQNYEAQSQIYLGDSNRTNLNAVLLLQQIAGSIRKY